MKDFMRDTQINLVTVSVVFIFMMLIALLWQASRKGLSCLDLITDKGSNRLSLTKTMNLVGGVVGAWAVMRMAIDKSLTEMLFAVYLAYCAGTHGFSTWLSAKFGTGARSSSTTTTSSTSSSQGQEEQK